MAALEAGICFDSQFGIVVGGDVVPCQGQVVILIHKADIDACGAGLAVVAVDAGSGDSVGGKRADTIFPFDQQHSWKAEDYKDAAEFYHEFYPVIMSYYGDEGSDLRQKTDMRPDVYTASMDEREKTHQFYDLFHECYMLVYNMEDSPLKVALIECQYQEYEELHRMEYHLLL